ncbi:MAG: MFS transporter [Nakamurella sp.]
MLREPEITAPRADPQRNEPADGGPGASQQAATAKSPTSTTRATGIPLAAVIPHMAVSADYPTTHRAARSTTRHSPSAASLPTGLSAHRPGLVLAIVLVAQLMVMLDSSIVNIALPDMSVALHFTPSSLSWVINAYTLAFGGLLLLGARAGDILGRRKVFVAGIALFSLASLAGGFAATGGELLAARVAQGIGAAFAAPSALAILMTLFPGTRERTRALGWFAAVSVGGAAIGLIAGGMLTQWASWRWVMFVNVPIGAALVVGILAVLPKLGRTAGRFDLAGALTATIGVTAVVYALVRAATNNWSDPLVLIGLVGGGTLLAGFVWIEFRAGSPIMPLRLFASRNRSASYLVRLFMTAGMMGMFFFMTQFIQEILDYSPIQAGVAFLPLTLFLFVMSMLTARVLAPRVSGRLLMIAGLVLATAALLLSSRLNADSSYLSLLLPLALFGTGAGLSFVPMTAMSLDGVAPADAGAASGLVNVSQQIGGAIGLAVLVSVFGRVTSPDTPALSRAAVRAAQQAFVTGESRALLVAAALMMGAVLLTVFAIRSPAASNTVKPAASLAVDEAVIKEMETTEDLVSA